MSNLPISAELIAEAFTVAHETGLTPRQLAERCKELEEAITRIADHASNSTRSGDAAMSSTLDDVASFARAAKIGGVA